VDEDGSPTAGKLYPYNLFTMVSVNAHVPETKDLLVSCVKEDLQTLLVSPGPENMAELVTSWAREDARRSSASWQNRYQPTVPAIFPEERRRIERRLKRVHERCRVDERT